MFELENTRSSERDDSKLRRGFEPRLEVCVDDTCNPYDHKPEPGVARPDTGLGRGGKRDLKRLSEWMKLVRAMEERKKNGETG